MFKQTLIVVFALIACTSAAPKPKFDDEAVAQCYDDTIASLEATKIPRSIQALMDRISDENDGRDLMVIPKQTFEYYDRPNECQGFKWTRSESDACTKLNKLQYGQLMNQVYKQESFVRVVSAGKLCDNTKDQKNWQVRLQRFFTGPQAPKYQL